MREINDTVISEALEAYVEAIYIFSQKKPSVRITDVALYLGLSKPSVNRAVNTLKKHGLVLHEPYGDIILTQKGRELGDALSDRHKMIKKFLIDVLDLHHDEAETEARRMEHSISKNTVDKMVSFMKS